MQAVLVMATAVFSLAVLVATVVALVKLIAARNWRGVGLLIAADAVIYLAALPMSSLARTDFVPVISFLWLQLILWTAVACTALWRTR